MQKLPLELLHVGELRVHTRVTYRKDGDARSAREKWFGTWRRVRTKERRTKRGAAALAVIVEAVADA
jgi:hypothetical protein